MLLGAVHLGLMLGLTDTQTPINPFVLALVLAGVAGVFLPGRFGSVAEMLPRVASFGVPLEQVRVSQRLLVAIHIVAQIGLGYVGSQLWDTTTSMPGQAGVVPLAAAIIVYAPAMAVVAASLSALYLWLTRRVGRSAEVLYAAASSADFKCFLRMHLSVDGSLTIYALAVDRASTRWKPNPDGAPGEPWFEPDQPLKARLIEPPVIVTNGRV